MSADQNIAGAPGTINLGGRTFLVAQPTDSDMRAIAAFLQKHALSPVAALEADPDFKYLPPEMQEEKRRDAALLKFKQGTPFDGPSALQALTGLEGTRFVAWILCRKREPTLTLEQVAGLITEANYLAAAVELDVASGMADLGNSAGRPGSATPS